MRKELPYVSSFVDNRGKRRWRYRRSGRKVLYLPSPVTDWEGHISAWQEAEEGKQLPKVGSDSIAALANSYYRSKDFIGVRPVTQATYRQWVDKLVDQYGHLSITTLARHNVERDLNALAHNPDEHNYRLRAWRMLLKHKGGEFQAFTVGLKAMKTAGTGRVDWGDDNLNRYRSKWPLGTRQRLAFDTFLHTTQRLSDVAAMHLSDISEGKIRVKQQKTGVSLILPIPPELCWSIIKTPRKSDWLIETSAGKKIGGPTLGNLIRTWRKQAGIADGFSAHGLRASGIRILAEKGRSNAQLKAVSGHKTDSEISRYTRGRDQELLAKQAILGE